MSDQRHWVTSVGVPGPCLRPDVGLTVLGHHKQGELVLKMFFLFSNYCNGPRTSSVEYSAVNSSGNARCCDQMLSHAGTQRLISSSSTTTLLPPSENNFQHLRESNGTCASASSPPTGALHSSSRSLAVPTTSQPLHGRPHRLRCGHERPPSR